MTKSPNPIDVDVGSRVRLRRMELRISQEKLGERIGITFQQIQKYEKGTNRIGSSRLAAIAAALEVPVSHFFADNGIPAAVRPTLDPQSIRLLQLFQQIRSPSLRRAIVSVAEAAIERDEPADAALRPKAA